MTRHSVLRTPDAAFDSLPGFPFAPHYVDDLPGFEGLRLHYLDEGPTGATRTFLCLHGEPTWSYVYRSMIPVFTAAGHRVVAPDFYGFGRSDKPVDDARYTFDFHRDTLLRLVERLGLHDVTLVCQDWGGLLGLTLPMAWPGRVTRLLAMNTAFATGERPPGRSFLNWLAYVQNHPDLDVAAVMQGAVPTLSAQEAAAYAAPFPDAAYKAGVRTFPALVPTAPDSPGAAVSRQARDWFATSWQGPCFMAVGAQDEVLGTTAMELLRSQVPGTPPVLVIPDAGHFVQEQAGERIARAALAAFT